MIVDPIRSGGVVPESVKRSLLEYLNGYSVCMYCPGDLHKITKPNIKRLIQVDLPEFMGADVVRLVHGAREAFFTVFYALFKEHVLTRGDRAPVIVVDGNTHYSLELAAERSLLKIIETETSGYPLFKVGLEHYEEALESVVEEHGKPPLVTCITYPDGKYGNFPDNIKGIIKLAREHGSYTLINAAYSIGRMPVSLRDLEADFIVGSAHKSMACSGPLGVLGMREEAASLVLKRSVRHPSKEVELLGCTVRGLPAVCLIMVMPYLRRRVKEWERVVDLARYFYERAERELGLMLLGEKPHSHDLLHFETPAFYKISLKLRDRFFLYKELKKRGIIGVKPGITKRIKLSTYLLNREEVDYVLDSLREILELGEGD